MFNKRKRILKNLEKEINEIKKELDNINEFLSNPNLLVTLSKKKKYIMVHPAVAE